jgi:uncharacterized membrane protein
MKLRRAEFFVIALVVLSFLLGLYLYPKLPERMASHWNAWGEVDGYMSRTWGVFLMPIILAGIALIFLGIPRLDPLKTNIEKFRSHYEGFMIVFFLFMISIQVQGLLWNMGIRISPNLVLPIGIGLLFYYVGILMGHAKRNWFIGIRTPWTLSSDAIWDRTHKLAGTLFKICGAVAFMGIFFRDYAVWFILVPALAVTLWTVIYSYVVFRKEKKGGDIL